MKPRALIAQNFCLNSESSMGIASIALPMYYTIKNHPCGGVVDGLESGLECFQTFIEHCPSGVLPLEIQTVHEVDLLVPSKHGDLRSKECFSCRRFQTQDLLML